MYATSLPIKTISETNAREHWTKRHRRRALQRSTTTLVTRQVLSKVSLPVVVRLERVSPGILDDDNLRGALKACRDGIADALGVNDGDPRITWEYAQRRGKRGEYAVNLTVRTWAETA